MLRSVLLLMLLAGCTNQQTVTIRWQDGDSTGVCNFDGKYYMLYIGTESNDYTRILTSNSFEKGDSLKWEIQLEPKNYYYFRIEELYPNWKTGNISKEYGVKL